MALAQNEDMTTAGELTPELELTKGYAERAGEQIYWEFACGGPDDDRPVVVLSHGAGGTHAIWYQQVPVLGQHFRVLTWDSRGFGNSTNNNDAPSAEAGAADLGAVLDQLDLRSVHLVGQSMGGWHIAALAEASPELVLSLTFADTVGGLWTPELKEAFAAFSAEGGGLRGHGPELVGRHRALWSGTAERDRAHAFLYQALGSFHIPPMDKLGETIRWEMTHSQIEAMGVPVLFIAGVHDEIFPAPLLRQSCERIGGATYVEIDDAGHSPYFEQPKAWNAALLEFLGAED